MGRKGQKRHGGLWLIGSNFVHSANYVMLLKEKIKPFLYKF